MNDGVRNDPKQPGIYSSSYYFLFFLWLSSLSSVAKPRLISLIFAQWWFSGASHFGLFGGHFSYECNDLPCLMETEWLKAVCLADMLKPHRPSECQTETKSMERVTEKITPSQVSEGSKRES